MLIENITLKICVPPVTENLEETKMPLSVLIRIAYYIQWACAKHVTLVIIIKEKVYSMRPVLNKITEKMKTIEKYTMKNIHWNIEHSTP